MFDVLGVLSCTSWGLLVMYLRSLSLIHKEQAQLCSVLQTSNIMLDDAPFRFQTPCKSWSTTIKMQFVEVILHRIPKCCNFLLIPDHQVLWYMEKRARQLLFFIYNHFFLLFLLSIVSVQGCQSLQMRQQCLMTPFCAQWCQKCVVAGPFDLYLKNVEVGKKIFDRTTMIFSLHAQWWGAILAFFLCHHFFYTVVGVLNVPWWRCS
jgi:hypothetical protein